MARVLHQERPLGGIHNVQPPDSAILLLHLADVRDYNEEVKAVQGDEEEGDRVLLVCGEPCHRGPVLREKGGETEDILISLNYGLSQREIPLAHSVHE